MMKVLVVDDDKASGSQLSEVVKRMGFKPVLVNNAANAINVAKLQTLHGALIDVLLPKMSGVDLAGELRRTRFGDAPIIFVSGVFKDKAFKEEALKKAAASDFLFKPFNVEDLQTALKTAIGDTSIQEKMSVAALLTMKLTSSRELGRAIEHLSRVKGPEFPYVLGLLMDAKLSGHINIVNDTGEIFGVTLSRGTLSDVDSSESQSTGVLALINNGFLTQEDWDDFQKNRNKKFPLDRLVEEGLVSPHAVSVAKQEQILYDFKAICGAENMQINFVPQDDSDEPPKHAVTLKRLLKLLASAMEELFPESYLAEFYGSVMTAPISCLRETKALEGVWGSKVFAPLTGLRENVETGGSLEAALAAHPDRRAEVFQALHYLILSRHVAFEDVNFVRTVKEMTVRFQQLYEDLTGKTPDRVFEYLGGGSDKPTFALVEKVFKEYDKTNSPAQLPKPCPPELENLCLRCYELVNAARETMVNEQKRSALYEARKQESVQRLKKSNELTAQALDMVKKGQFSQAVETLKQAETLHATSLQFMIRTWAMVKGNLVKNKAELLAMSRSLGDLSAEDRKSTYWFMAMGVVRKALGDSTAPSFFEKVLKMDATFAEARRELNAAGPASAGKELKLNELLTGDITDIVSQLFRARAK